MGFKIAFFVVDGGTVDSFPRFISHFTPLISFYTPWKHQKTMDFRIFSGSLEIEHWPYIGKITLPMCKITCQSHVLWYGSSHPELVSKKVVLKNFWKFTWKRLYQCLFLNKVAGLSPAALLKKRLWHRCCPAKFAKFLITPFFPVHLQWRLLLVQLIDYY